MKILLVLMAERIPKFPEIEARTNPMVPSRVGVASIKILKKVFDFIRMIFFPPKNSRLKPKIKAKIPINVSHKYPVTYGSNSLEAFATKKNIKAPEIAATLARKIPFFGLLLMCANDFF